MSVSNILDFAKENCPMAYKYFIYGGAHRGLGSTNNKKRIDFIKKGEKGLFTFSMMEDFLTRLACM